MTDERAPSSSKLRLGSEEAGVSAVPKVTLSKGKEKAVETGRGHKDGSLDQELLRRWGKRYPLLNGPQLNMMVSLENGARARSSGHQRTPAQLADLHFDLAHEGRDGGQGGKEVEPSVGSFAYVLKYAHERSDDKTLRQIGQEAIAWQQRHQQRAQRVAEGPGTTPVRQKGDDLKALVRNLRLSLAVRTHQFHIRGGTLERVGGIKVPSAQPRLLADDEHFVHSRLLRARINPLRLHGRTTEVEDEEGLEDPAQPRVGSLIRSSRPRTHHSRRLQRFFRLAQGTTLHDAMHSTESRGPSVPTKSVPVSKHQRRLLDINKRRQRQQQEQAVSEHNRAREGSNNATAELIYEAFKHDGSDSRSEAIIEDLKRWEDEVSRRRAIRRRVLFDLDMLRQYRGTTTSNLKGLEQSAAPSDQSREDVVPAWLLLSALKVCADRGQVAEADRLVENYLRSLYETRRRSSAVSPQTQEDEEAAWASLVPRNAKTHAIQEANRPPNGPVLLNSILRAALSSAHLEAFEAMLGIIERWCVGSEGLLAELCPTRPASTQQAGHPRCLTPNETSVLLLIEAVRTRRKRAEIGHDVVETFVQRWGPPTGGLRISTRATRGLIGYALGANRDADTRSQYIRKLLESHLQWIKTSDEKEFPLPLGEVSHWRGAEVYRWKNLMNRLVKLKLLNRGEAVHLSYGRTPNKWKFALATPQT